MQDTMRVKYVSHKYILKANIANKKQIKIFCYL